MSTPDEEVLLFLAEQWVPVRQMLRTMSRGDSLTADIFHNCLIREFKIPQRLHAALLTLLLDCCRYHDIVHTESLRHKVDIGRRIRHELECGPDPIEQQYFKNAPARLSVTTPPEFPRPPPHSSTARGIVGNSNSAAARIGTSNNQNNRYHQQQQQAGGTNYNIPPPCTCPPECVCDDADDNNYHQQHQQHQQAAASSSSQHYEPAIVAVARRNSSGHKSAATAPPPPASQQQQQQSPRQEQQHNRPNSAQQHHQHNNNFNNISPRNINNNASSSSSSRRREPTVMAAYRAVAAAAAGNSANPNASSSALPTHMMNSSHRGCTPKVDTSLRREGLRAQFLKATGGVSVVTKPHFREAVRAITPWEVPAQDFEEMYDAIKNPATGRVHVDDFCHRFAEEYVQNSSSFAVSYRPCFAPIGKSPRYYRSSHAGGGGGGGGGGSVSRSGSQQRGGSQQRESSSARGGGGGGGGGGPLPPALPRAAIVAKAQREQEEKERLARRVVRLTRASELRKEVGAMFRKTVDSYDGYLACGVLPSPRRPASAHMVSVGSAGVVTGTVHLPDPPLPKKYHRINTRIEADGAALGNSYGLVVQHRA